MWKIVHDVNQSQHKNNSKQAKPRLSGIQAYERVSCSGGEWQKKMSLSVVWQQSAECECH